jgi:acyl dehydratase
MIRPPRTFEDLVLGEKRRSETVTISEQEILDFARRYDPQWFHCDVEAAKESHFGQVVASGVHVLAIWRQLDHAINGDIDFVCGVGFDELRLKNALRAGDSVYVTSEITMLKPSQSRIDRGTALTRYAMINQNGADVVTFTSINLVYTRAAR